MPTRFPNSPNLVQPSLLNHIWTNFLPPSLSGIIHLCTSDHLLIFIHTKNHTPSNTLHKITFMVINVNNQIKFINELKSINWNELLVIKISTCSIIQLMTYNKCFPIKTKLLTQKNFIIHG